MGGGGGGGAEQQVDYPVPSNRAGVVIGKGGKTIYYKFAGSITLYFIQARQSTRSKKNPALLFKLTKLRLRNIQTGNILQLEEINNKLLMRKNLFRFDSFFMTHIHLTNFRKKWEAQHRQAPRSRVRRREITVIINIKVNLSSSNTDSTRTTSHKADNLTTAPHGPSTTHRLESRLV